MGRITPGTVTAETRRKARFLCNEIAPYPRPTTAQRVEMQLSRWIVEAEEALLKLGTKDPALFDAYQARRRILKRLADGLAWHLFGTDEHWIKIQAAHPPVGYMTGKRGYVAEREAVLSVLERPDVMFAMQNDSTNILRFGDVTFVTTDWEASTIEVKSSSAHAQTDRTERQRTRMKMVTEYLRTDASDVLFSRPLRAIQLDWRESHYWKELERAIRQAAKNGSALECCDKAVAICCSRRGFKTDAAMFLRRTGWKKPSVSFGVLNRHVEVPMDDDDLRYIRPLTAFEISPAALYPVVTSDVEVLVLVNLDRIRQAIADRGLVVRDSADGRFRVSASAKEGEVEVIEGPWLRLIYTMLTVPSFVSLIEQAARRRSDGVFPDGNAL